MSLPCERSKWGTIPMIRKRIVYYMVREMHMSQKACAEKLDLTPSAISQYLRDKRGNGGSFDLRIEEEIRKSAYRISEGKDYSDEICRVCNMVRA